MSLNTIDDRDCFPCADAIVNKDHLLDRVAIPLDSLTNGLYRRGTVQELIHKLYNRRLLVFDHLGCTWVDVQIFALLEVSETRVHL